MADIASVNHTVWVLNSNAARPDALQSFCGGRGARYVLFVGRNRPGTTRGRSPGTTRDRKAQDYSIDQMEWIPLAGRLGDVTGDIKRSTTGLWLELLEQVHSGSLDLHCFIRNHDDQILELSFGVENWL
jgi:hypothetical protein